MFTLSGVLTGHERAYNPWGAHPWGRYVGEVGWEAAAYLADFDGPVFHVVRDPLKVVGSYLGYGFFEKPQDNAYQACLRRFEPRVFEYRTSVEKGMARYLYWNQRVEEWTKERFRIEDFDLEKRNEIAAAVGYPPVPHLPPVPTDTHHWPRKNIGWDDMPDGALKGDLQRMAEGYGYG